MRLSLGTELERFVRNQVAKGQFQSADQVVRSAVQAMKDQEDWIVAHADSLRQLVAAGLEELDRGEGEPWDPEEIKKEGKRLLASRTGRGTTRKRKQR
jgi:putative addiction module CopG family antidote